MARISLRDYNREIEELVDSGRTDEAIAHCRYILETYPKHINTYRSLGKALLESQRYGDAADVFKRVLACIPDDFIAHLGMSIIREDEGDLDGSIWHMERAFEVQPSNAAVQSELRRLYGRRDGLTPAKVQLTRGAMARMSAKSHLYSQAIAELRTALADDPQRPDLQALLARMYTHTGQRLAAIETCNALLGRFPYCLEANRLMVEILPGTERAAEAETYRKRLEELDPYESHISPAAATADQVQAGVITLERLDYLDVHGPVETGPAQPQWASSLGVSIDQGASSEEPVPDWLSATGESPAEGAGVSTEATPTEGEIPDWMREAGWEPASGETEESMPGFESSEELEPGELARAEIPDWLQGLAPGTEPSPETPPPGQTLDAGEKAARAAILAAGVNEVQPGSEEPGTGEQIAGVPETPSMAEQEGTPAGEVAEETGSILTGAGEAAILGASLAAGAVLSAAEDETQETEEDVLAVPEPGGEPVEEELPDWLKPTTTELAMQAESESLPDWLVSASEEAPPVEEEAELPDWMEPIEGSLSGVEAAGIAAASSEIPEWLQEISPEGESSTVTTTSTESESETSELTPGEGAPQGVAEWLAESAPEIPAESFTGELAEKEQVEGIPEWLAQLSPEDKTEASATIVPEVEEQDTGLEQAEIPQWLREMEGSRTGEGVETAEARAPEPPPMEIEETGLEAGEIPDWLKAAMAIEAVDQVVEPLVEEPEAAEAALIEGDTKPVRVFAPAETISAEPVEIASGETELATTEEAIEEFEVEQAAGIEPEEISLEEAAEVSEAEPLPEDTGMPGIEDEEQAMAWLESLAARQGVSEEELLTSPEERAAETPEWIQQFAEESVEEGEIPEEEKPSEGVSGIAGLAGAAAAGWVAKQVFEEEVTEEPVPVVPQPVEQGLEEIIEEEKPSEGALDISELAGVAAAGLAARQVFEEEVTEEPAPVVSPPVEQVPEEITKEPVAAEPVIEEAEIPEAVSEAAEAEEAELPEWLRGLEEEAVTQDDEAAEEWSPPAEFAIPEPLVETSHLDINTASLSQLERIPGVGFIIAQSIVAYREVNGPFTSLDQLHEIPGITPETSEELKQNLFVEEIVKVTPPAPTIPELEHAWQNIANGNIPTAVDQYSYFIRQEQHLDEIITELQEAVLVYPQDALLYQTLGDAYLRTNRLQEAMEAYNHAEDLLK